jgi:hypothetical protein
MEQARRGKTMSHLLFKNNSFVKLVLKQVGLKKIGESEVPNTLISQIKKDIIKNLKF